MNHQVLQAIGVSGGIRIGKAFVYKGFSPETDQVEQGQLTENEVPEALARLQAAKEEAGRELEALIEKTKATAGEEQAQILSAQLAFLSDPALFPEIEKKVREDHLRPEAAVTAITKQFADQFEAMDNEYFRERATDVKDLGRRLSRHLIGIEGVTLADIDEEVILVADDLTPSDTVQLDKAYVLGFVTQLGGKTSHTAILSKSLGIPAIVGLGDGADQIEQDTLLIMDGSTGEIIVDPDEATIEQYRAKKAQEEEQESRLQQLAAQNAVTKDGMQFEIAANIGTPEETGNALERGAEGIGLYRTEFLFMNSKEMPTEDEQFQAYRDVLQQMGDRPTVIRTLDIGGDKELPYLDLPEEMNPFLGYRAIRLGLDRPELFKVQLRALARASAYGNLKIMFPMVSSMEEWRQAKALYEEAKQEVRNEGNEVKDDTELGIMVEIPSVAVLADAFAKEVNFFSIGTNDLVQYTLAVDRMNERIDYLYDYFHPAVLQLIQNVIRAGHEAGKWVGMCGGMAGDPLAAPVLAGMKLDEWSMDAGSVPKVKHMITQLSSEDCVRLTNEVLTASTAEEVRGKLKAYVAELDLNV